MLTHRQNAKRRTVIWQASAAALLVAAGAVVALSQVRTALAPPAPPKPPVMVVDNTPKGPAAIDSKALMDVSLVMGRVNPTVIQPPPPPPEKPIAEAEPLPPPPPPPTTWTYIGSIITPTSRSAVVKIDETQQIVRLGSTYNDAELVTVESKYIEIKKGVSTERIALAERKMLVPTDQPKRPVAFRATPSLPGSIPGGTMTFGAKGVPPGPGANGQPPVTFDQARAAAQAARDMAAREAAARAGQPVNPPGREDASPEREMMAKMLSDPNISHEERTKVLGAMGITPGMGMEGMMEVAKKHGVDLNKETMQAFEKLSKAEEEQKESK